jgi:Helix-turn-helix domain
VPCGAGQGFVGTAWQALTVRTAYRCRAYPDAAQQAALNRTFGCVRVVWNAILAARRERYAAQRTGTSYGQASAELTAMKQDPQRAWLNEVSCVPLQQALRHQEQAFAAFFARKARYPLSFTACLGLVALLSDLVRAGAQAVVATHSPMVAALPGASLLELGEWGMRPVRWDELDIVGHWRRFLREPDSYFRHWLDG